MNSEEELERIGVENVRWALLGNTQISNLERDQIWAWLRRKYRIDVRSL